MANYYLLQFDKQVKNIVPNVYYGRYVDDILVVIENPEIDFYDTEKCKEVKLDIEKLTEGIKASELTKAEKFILERFHPIINLIETPSFIKKTDSKRIFKIACVEGAYIQPDKTLIYFFDKGESTAVIDKLKHDLDVRASEFRDFPEDNEDMAPFDESAYHLIFDDSEGKIRTLKDYKENRLGLSVFLANRIFAALRRTGKTNGDESEKLLLLFRGLNNLEHFRLWEKIFTFFLVNNDKERFVRFFKHTKEQIENLNNKNKIAGSSVQTRLVAQSLREYLKIAIEMTLSLFPQFINEKDRGHNEIKEYIDYVEMNESLFRATYLLRHNYEVHPLVIFAKEPPENLTNNDISVLSKEGATKFDYEELNEIDKIRIPRKVKFWECCIAKVNEWITQDDKDKISNCDDYHLNCNFSDIDMLDKAFDIYKNINNLYFDEEDHKNKFYSYNPIKSIETNNWEIINEVRIGSKPTKETKDYNNPMLAIANTKVSNVNIEKSVLGEPHLSSSRYNTLTKVLKEARLAGSKMLILPECSVPVALLPSLARYSAQNQMAIVTGVEHWNVKGVVYNFIVTIAPVVVDHGKDAVVLYRLKNHYSPAEENMIRGYGFKVPKPYSYRYDLINWQGIYFTSFYCFEIANSLHRSLFRSKLDLMIISEWNPDIPYFDNVVGATSRDLHCYIAQVNTSQYGDSRITQPTKSEIKDILKLKGGTNDTVLTDTIDLERLRNFQLKSYELTKHDNDDFFKPLPPDWDREAVKRRIKGDFVIYH